MTLEYGYIYIYIYIHAFFSFTYKIVDLSFMVKKNVITKMELKKFY